MGAVKWIPEENAESHFLSNRGEGGRASPEIGAWHTCIVHSYHHCFGLFTGMCDSMWKIDPQENTSTGWKVSEKLREIKIDKKPHWNLWIFIHII